jgi:hypothetical protein
MPGKIDRFIVRRVLDTDPKDGQGIKGVIELIDPIGGLKGYSFGESLADLTELAAVPVSLRVDKQVRYVESVKAQYAYDGQASAGDVQPDDSNGTGVGFGNGWWSRYTAIPGGIDGVGHLGCINNSSTQQLDDSMVFVKYTAGWSEQQSYGSGVVASTVNSNIAVARSGLYEIGFDITLDVGGSYDYIHCALFHAGSETPCYHIHDSTSGGEWGQLSGRLVYPLLVVTEELLDLRLASEGGNYQYVGVKYGFIWAKRIGEYPG